MVVIIQKWLVPSGVTATIHLHLTKSQYVTQEKVLSDQNSTFYMEIGDPFRFTS